MDFLTKKEKLQIKSIGSCCHCPHAFSRHPFEEEENRNVDSAVHRKYSIYIKYSKNHIYSKYSKYKRIWNSSMHSKYSKYSNYKRNLDSAVHSKYRKLGKSVNTVNIENTVTTVITAITVNTLKHQKCGLRWAEKIL